MFGEVGKKKKKTSSMRVIQACQQESVLFLIQLSSAGLMFAEPTACSVRRTPIWADAGMVDMVVCDNATIPMIGSEQTGVTSRSAMKSSSNNALFVDITGFVDKRR